MKIVKLLTFTSILLFNVSTAECNNDLPKEIFKHWIHSYEEDTRGVNIYRPGNYNFPRSRGRESFEIKENGEFIQYGIGPTDRVVKVSGRWEVEEKVKIVVYLESKDVASYTINIISCTSDILKIKNKGLD